MNILLRRAIPEDAATLATLEVTIWRVAYRGLMPDAFLDSLSEKERTASWHQNLLKHGTSGRKRVLVAIENGTIVGFVRIGLAREEGEVGLVYLLYVLPQYWQRGVGTALMRAAMDELCNLGTTEAVLWVLRDNQRARRFYEALGWSQDGRTNTEDYGGVELAALCYRKTVSA